MDNLKWDQLKWLLVFIAAGYAPMLGLIYYLLKRLMEARERSEKLIERVIPLVQSLERVVKKMELLTEKLLQKLIG